MSSAKEVTRCRQDFILLVGLFGGRLPRDRKIGSFRIDLGIEERALNERDIDELPPVGIGQLVSEVGEEAAQSFGNNFSVIGAVHQLMLVGDGSVKAEAV